MSTPRKATVTVIAPEADGDLFTVKARSFGGGEAGIGFEQSYETQEDADARADELRTFYRRSGFTTDGLAPIPQPRMPAPKPRRTAPLVMPMPVAPVDPEPEPEPVHHTVESVWGAVA